MKSQDSFRSSVVLEFAERPPAPVHADSPIRLLRRWQWELEPFLSTAEVAERLGSSLEAVHYFAGAGHLLTVSDANGLIIYPSFAFGDTEPTGSLSLVPGLATVLHALDRSNHSERWLSAVWLSGGLERHGSWCAIDELLAGRRSEVLERARNENWAWIF